MALLAALLAPFPAPAADPPPAGAPLRLQVIGGLADTAQYAEHEEPFWRETVPQITQGRVRAEIAPFDRSGIRGDDLLHLMRLNVVPVGTLLMSLIANDEPELAAPNLALLAGRLGSLREAVAAYRPHLTQVLAERYDTELLAIFTYPAQVLFCRGAFEGLADIRGRKVRVSGASQADAVEALGGIAVVTPFAAITDTMRRGGVDCVITGTLSGVDLGLGEVATHVHAMPFGWGLAIVAANRRSWHAIPAPLREILQHGLAGLEDRVWQAAQRDTEEGLACAAGRPGCRRARSAKLVVVPASAADEALRLRLFDRVVLESWLRRCGQDCLTNWNRYLASPAGLPPRRMSDP